MFILQTIDPVQTATALSNPEIWLGVLLFVLIAAVVLLWRQLTKEREESKKDFKDQLILLTKVEGALLSHKEILPIISDIKSSIESIKAKI